MSQLVFSLNRSTSEAIATHLDAVQHLFHPPLRQRVDIARYASKLFDKAVRFEAWDGDRLVGLVAAYVDIAARSFFISNVSTSPDHVRRGIASSLMHQCVGTLAADATTSGTLEVHSSNHSAVRLYRQLGFEALDLHNGVLRMKRESQSVSGGGHEKS